ncbi:MAG: DUF3842 family protein [Halanaerobium sp.]|nr:DUF3842 family protein [Halanaerobium sp.]
MKKIAVIDGLGGGLGSQIVSGINNVITGREIEIIALGTNSGATTRMIKAGADKGATGTNAIKVMAGQVDIIVGPIGIMIPDSMLGEISPFIVSALVASGARKVLLPIQQTHLTLVGLRQLPMKDLIQEAVKKVEEFLAD